MFQTMTEERYRTIISLERKLRSLFCLYALAKDLHNHPSYMWVSHQITKKAWSMLKWSPRRFLCVTFYLYLYSVVEYNIMCSYFKPTESCDIIKHLFIKYLLVYWYIELFFSVTSNRKFTSVWPILHVSVNFKALAC